MTPSSAKAVVGLLMDSGVTLREIVANGAMNGVAELVELASEADTYTIGVEIIEGLKIEAIKAIRAITGWGLKEAKDFVDSHYQPGIQVRAVVKTFGSISQAQECARRVDTSLVTIRDSSGNGIHY